MVLKIVQHEFLRQLKQAEIASQFVSSWLVIKSAFNYLLYFVFSILYIYILFLYIYLLFTFYVNYLIFYIYIFYFYIYIFYLYSMLTIYVMLTILYLVSILAYKRLQTLLLKVVSFQYSF